MERADVMKEYAKEFYKSKRWQKCREAYLRSVGGLCERCAKQGIIKAAVIVHHKIYITPSNINNPEVALNFDNLEALCRDCHNQEHIRVNKHRYKVDKNGKVIL